MSLPDGWKTVTIEDCCEILDSKRIPVNGEEREKRIGSIPYYGANGIQGFIDDFIFDEPLILIAEDGGCFDEFATRPIAYQVFGKSWVNNHAHVLRAKDEYCQNAIFYSLEHKDIQPFIVGGTRTKLNQSALRSISLVLPCLTSEQSKMAEILSTVDRAIEQTEALISKQQRIKTGLMQDLLTRGIDEHGNLRSESTHQFKDSPLGRIPIEWKVETLGQVIGPIVSGWSPTCESEASSEDEWAILKTTAVVWPGYAQGENKRLPSNLRGNPAIEVKQDDILITRKGPVERVGVVVHVANTRAKLMIPDTVFRVQILDPTQNVPAFLPLALGSAYVQSDWFQKKIGLADAQVNLNHSILRSTLFAKPEPAEQSRIVSRIDQASIQASGDGQQLAKLRVLKLALMQDLLTGKKRVTSLLEPEPTH